MMWDSPDTSCSSGLFDGQSSSPQQIVYPSDFDRYIDAELDKSPPTIDPALLSLIGDSSPWGEISFTAPPAGTSPTSGSPPSLYSDVSSPPTFPVHVDTHTTEATTSGAGDRPLTDAEVDALLRFFSPDASSQEANDPDVPFRVDIGMHPSTIISHPAGVPPAHLYPSGIISVGSEQSQQRYYGAVVADAYSQGTGMQVDVCAEGDYEHSNEGTSDIRAAHLYPTRGDVVGLVGLPGSSSETREVLRTQLVERPAKKFPCPMIDCTSGELTFTAPLPLSCPRRI
ncbi:hypothetical protein C2E23DRAFT_620377 [Lenzites betulinus]|nr:hypothetical protein C2E23DRAFT_620377 [Lenzites betulinus]